MTVLEMKRRSDRVIVSPPSAPDGAAVTVVRLDLSGGALWFDTGEPDPTPVVEIYDIDAASWWLFSLYGIDTAETVIQFVQDPHLPTTAVEAHLGAAADGLRRLALALWLVRWRPGPSGAVIEIPMWLLEVEAGVLADELVDALDRDHDLVAMLLAPHLPRIAANLADHDLRVDGSAVDISIDRILRESARVALDVVADDVDGFDVLDAVERAATATDRDTRTLRAALADDTAVMRELGLLHDSLRGLSDEVYELAAGVGDVFCAPDGSAPVDPRAVPGGIVSAARDAISWVLVTEGDGIRCDVSVELVQGARVESMGQFFARIDQGSCATTVVALAKRGPLLHGEAWLDAGCRTDDLRVTVYTGIDGLDAVAPRDRDSRLSDRDAIARVVAARTSEARLGVSTAWNAPFAAELASAASTPLR